MKKLSITAVASVILLSACASEPAAPEAKAVDPFVGKQLVSANGEVVFEYSADGTVGGVFRGADVMGVYTSDATEICTTFSAPEQLTGREYCSTPDFQDGTGVFNRRDGSQSAVYTVAG